MSNDFNPTNLSNLIGLWDFRSGAENKDTGLGDGIAQNGTFEGNAFASGGSLKLDGHGDYFDVCGPDDPFDLTEATVIVQFNQEEHVGSSPDSLVNRGEYEDRGTDGFFNISVTKDGAVKLIHCANSLGSSWPAIFVRAARSKRIAPWSR